MCVMIDLLGIFGRIQLRTAIMNDKTFQFESSCILPNEGLNLSWSNLVTGGVGIRLVLVQPITPKVGVAENQGISNPSIFHHATTL